MKWRKISENIILWGLVLASALVAIIDFLPEEIQPISFRDRIPAMILFIVSVITAAQALERKGDIVDSGSRLEQILKSRPVQVLEENNKIAQLGVDSVEKAKRSIRLAIFGGFVSASTDLHPVTQKYFEALEKKLKQYHAEGKDFKYQCVLGYNQDALEKLRAYVSQRNEVHEQAQVSEFVEYKWLEGRTGFNITLIDDIELFIAFTSFRVTGYQKVFKFADDPELVKNISSWFDDLWSKAKTEP